MRLGVHNGAIWLQDGVANTVLVFPVKRTPEYSLGFFELHFALLFGFHPLIVNPRLRRTNRQHAQQMAADRIHPVHAFFGQMDVVVGDIGDRKGNWPGQFRREAVYAKREGSHSGSGSHATNHHA